jgi:hypothetical protein
MSTYTPNGNADAQTDGTTDNSVSPNVLIFRNLGSTNHTVLITLLDAKTTVVDYIGTLMSPADCPSFFCVQPCRMDATGYATAPASANDAVITAAKAAIKAELYGPNFSDYPIVIADTDPTYDVTTLLYTDHIHPNDLGHAAIKNAVAYCIQSSSNVTGVLKFSPTGFDSYSPQVGSVNASGIDRFIFGVNNNILTNGALDLTKTHGQLRLNASTAGGSLQWYRGATSGGTLTKIFEIDDNAVANFSGFTTRSILNFGSAGYSVDPSAGTTRIFAGATEVAGVFTARNTSATGVHINTSYVSFTANTGLTNGSTFSSTERARVNSNGNFLIGSATENARLYVSQPVLTSAWLPALRVTPGTHTGMTAGTIWPVYQFDGSTQQAINSGSTTLALQPIFYIKSSQSNPGTGNTNTDFANFWSEAPTRGTGTTTNLYGIGTDGSLKVGGAVVHSSYTTQTTTYSILESDHVIHCTSGTFTVTLPASVASTTGKIYIVVNSGAGTITLATTGAQTFLNVSAAPTTLTKVTVGTWVLQSAGAAGWLLISSL